MLELVAAIVVPNEFGGVTEEDVARFEQDLGEELPADYRSFLLRSNGGVPDPSHWHVGPTENRPGFGWTPLGVSVKRFFALVGAPSYADLDRQRTVYAGRIPIELLAISDDGAGNKICLGLRGDVRGSIWYWNHEWESDAEPPGWDNLLQLTESFTSFFGGLLTWEEHEQRVDADLRQVIGKDGPSAV